MSPRCVWLLVFLLLAVHAGLLLEAAWRDFVTVDEAAHLAAGISYWKTGRYGLYGVNPPLVRQLAVLPLLAAGPDISSIPGSDNVSQRLEFAAGHSFARDNAERYMLLVFLGRLTAIGWSLLGGWLVFRWAGELFGPGGGLIALAVWCFEPNVLAHGHLFSCDLPATVAALAATYSFWRYLHAPSWRGAALAGVLLGVALLTKFTLLILLPIWAVLGFMHGFMSNAARRPWRTVLGHASIILTVALLVVNLDYEFQGTGTPLGQYTFVSKWLTGQEERTSAGGNRFRETWLGSVPMPLPAAFVSGIDVQARDFEGSHLSYLRGEWRYPGWWYWYIYALAVKVPLGTWALVLASLTLALWGHPANREPLSSVAQLGERGRGEGVIRGELALWLTAAAILAFVSTNTGYTNHLRYALPVLPFVIIATGKLAWFVRERHYVFAGFMSLMLLWSIVSTLSVRPHYLSYFNDLAGGPENGHLHLLDSNIDWGQDLTYLKEWLDEHPEARPLHLAYFNLIDPRIIGIEFELPPYGIEAMLHEPEKWADAGPQPGWFALSVNHFVGHHLVGVSDGRGNRVVPPPGAYRYFRHFQPVARVGYSIWIYHLTEEDVERYRRAFGVP